MQRLLSIFKGKSLFLWSYGAVLAVVFILGGAIRFTLPTLPMMDPDTGSYLQPAVGMVMNGVYVPTFRGFLYPFFLTVVLKISPHLYSIALIQHILGLITAALVVLIILRARIFLPPGWFLSWAARLVALVAACGFLFFRSTIILEHSIRPEGVFPFLCAIILLSGVEFSRHLFFNKNYNWATATCGITLIAFSVGIYFLRPAWGLAIGTSLMPLFLAWFLIPGRWVWKLAISFIGMLLAILLFILPEFLLKKKFESQCGPDLFLPASILAVHADILYHIFQRDALQMPLKSKERAVLLTFTQDIQSALKNPTEHYSAIDFAPNDLQYGGPIKRLRQFTSPERFAKFCYYYYYRAWIEQPIPMLNKIMRQMNLFYSLKGRKVYDIEPYFLLKNNYKSSLKSFLDWKYTSWHPLDTYCERLQKLDLPEKIPLLHPLVKRFALYLNYTFLPLLIFSSLGAFIVFLSGSRFVELRPAAILLLYFSSFNFVNCLSISITYMMDIYRYHFNQITMSLVSQGFELLFLVSLIFIFVQRWRHRESYLDLEFQKFPPL